MKYEGKLSIGSPGWPASESVKHFLPMLRCVECRACSARCACRPGYPLKIGWEKLDSPHFAAAKEIYSFAPD